MRTWTADAITTGHPAEVLDVLTDPDAISRWAPIPFEVEGLDSRAPRRPVPGRACVGKLAGFGVAFDVEVNEADEQGLSLVADGPIGIDVDYQLRPHASGSAVRANGVRPPRARGCAAACSPRPPRPCSPAAPWPRPWAASPAT